MSPKKILYLDLDGVLVDFQSGIDRLDPAVRSAHAGNLDEADGIFAKMEPMPGALEAFSELSAAFDTYLLSTAPWRNPSAWCDKLLWVQKHLGEPATKRLILSHNKHLNLGDYLVDDALKNGADRFTGMHIHFGQGEFAGWPEVRAYLMAHAWD